MKVNKLWKVITKPRKPVMRQRAERQLILYQPITTEQRFHQSYEKVESGCWEWTGKRDRYGYGKFIAKGRLTKAHRFAFELFNGKFDYHLHVLHRCDTPCCVNPQHLFLGTNHDNIQDRMQKGRSRTSYKKLTEEEKHAIVGLLGRKTLTEIAKEFEVDVRTIRKLYQNGHSAKTA